MQISYDYMLHRIIVLSFVNLYNAYLEAIFKASGMNKFYLAALALILLASCSKSDYLVENPSIIPAPVSLQVKDGSFSLLKANCIYYTDNLEEVEEVADYFTDLIRQKTGIVLESKFISERKQDKPCFEFLISDTVKHLNSEGYYLSIKPEVVRIVASSTHGLFYGIQSIRQLFPPEFESGKAEPGINWLLPAVEIADQPAFPWRGMLLDCSRHFMEPDFVKRYIDLLAYHKMNRFHWHLTEDQGWRIEIKAFPELTEVGAWRIEEDGTRYGGYYTQEQIKEIVEYARVRQIEVVPEIELPGQSMAALASYPHLSCTGDSVEVANRWGVFKDIYCAGKETTFEFLQQVMDEVVLLFPYEYIHIGGDEAPKYRWDNCPDCQRSIKQENLKDEAQLQSFFIQRVANYLGDTYQRRIIGWDEILEGGLASSATVQSWRGFEGAMEAVHQHHQAIVSPTSHAYFDYPVESIDLQKVYSFNPIPAGLEPEYHAYILGGECNLWTEKAPQDKVDDRMFPRMLAMAEVLWTNPADRNYTEFHERVENHYEKLDNLGVEYGFESKAISFEADYHPEDQSIRVNLIAGQKGFDIYYSVDGSEPGRESNLYTEAVKITQSTQLKAVTMKESGGPEFRITNDFYIHVGNQKPIVYAYPYSPNYPGGGDVALVDGVGGSDNFRDNHWQGFFGTPLDVVIDLGETKELCAVECNFLQSVLSWIYMPAKLNVYGSNDGVQYKSLASYEPGEDMHVYKTYVSHYSIPFEKQSCRYIRFEAVSIGKNPEWHDAAGLDTWLFCDEIILK